MIYENGDLLVEAERFALDEQLIAADVDLDRIALGPLEHEQLRRLDPRSPRAAADVPARAASSSACADEPLPLRRTVERFPYVPADPATRNERCYEVYNIQVHGLETRLRATGIKKVVIGISGGLDSTHALIVCAQAMDRLGLPRENVLAYTMPGFATSEHTKGNAWKLMQALGVSAREIDIRPSRRADARRPRAPVRARARSTTTSPSRTSRRASAPRTCSAWPTTTAGSSSAPAT